MIQLTDADIDMEEVRDKLVGAGVLPVSLNEHGDPIMLLGKERYINHWRGSLKWSGFEGGRKFVDGSIELTAAREFYEESLGAVNMLNKTQSSIENILKIIHNREYMCRVLLCIEHEDTREKRYHVTYVIEVPKDVQCIERFNNTRKQLIDMQYRFNQFKKLTEQILFEYPFVKEGCIINNGKVIAITSVVVFENELTVLYNDEDGKKSIQEQFCGITAEKVLLYNKWFITRQKLNEDLETFDDICKSAAHVERNCLGFFQDGKINDEYLEKQQIDWWNVSDLKIVLQKGGFLRNEFFREYFLPVMQRTIQELDKYK
jgi:hypothetical protein